MKPTEKALKKEIEKPSNQLQGEFFKKLSDKKIPIRYARGYLIESEEQMDIVVSELEEKFIDDMMLRSR